MAKCKALTRSAVKRLNDHDDVLFTSINVFASLAVREQDHNQSIVTILASDQKPPRVAMLVAGRR